MIALRIATGIHSHFPERITEWLSFWPLFGMGLALLHQPDMFGTSSSFSTLRLWAYEETWALTVLLFAVNRAFALIINGTFHSFPYSPHLRALSSFCGAIFWFLFTAGFLKSAIDGDGAWSAVVAYSSFLSIETVNIYRSSVDVGRSR